MKMIDNFLNRITMYRLVLYGLIGLWCLALIFSFAGLLSFGPLALIILTAAMIAICLIINEIFARTFGAWSNLESVIIAAMILTMIITPSLTLSGFMFVFWASVWAMASKYIMTFSKKHFFNPAAFAVALTGLALGQGASWWVGQFLMLPFVAIIAFLVIRKMRAFELVAVFLATATITIVGYRLLGGSNPLTVIQRIFFDSPIIFLAGFMLIEPVTMPPNRRFRMMYGALVGLLFGPFVHLGPIFSTPELALLIGNLFSYAVSPKYKLNLVLNEKVSDGSDQYDFVFLPERSVNYKAGQYMEFTLAHPGQDNRGIRRYFTLASAPSEIGLRIGVKFYPEASTFKQALLAMNTGDRIVAAQLAGDFVLPKDPQKKLVFIAGGIGVTPFRSMIMDLLARNEHRSIALVYSNRTEEDITYRNIFDQAEKQLGIKTVYALSEIDKIRPDWPGVRGMVTGELLAKEIPDYRERTFYLSGPHGMVSAFEKTLKKMGVPNRQIKIDFFPGFA